MFTEDPTVFLSDFGVSVAAGAVSGLGILDMPGQEVLDGMVISTNYSLTVRADEFGDLGFGDVVQVGGEAYLVQEVMLISDGKFCTVQMEKTAGPVIQIRTLDGYDLVALDGRSLVAL